MARMRLDTALEPLWNRAGTALEPRWNRNDVTSLRL